MPHPFGDGMGNLPSSSAMFVMSDVINSDILFFLVFGKLLEAKAIFCPVFGHAWNLGLSGSRWLRACRAGA